MDYLWSPWRYEYITGSPDKHPAGSDDCVFCRMAAEPDDARTFIVYRAHRNFIVLNRFPYTSGHVMVVPYEHTALLADLPEETASEMMLLARRTQGRLSEVYRPEGFNLGMNLGKCAGAGIAGHIHLHVLPRWTGDANFMSTVGETRVLPEELGETWRKLKEAFARP